MEPCFEPIRGISLERYADLGAAVADVLDDEAKVAEILAAEAVPAADWEAAKTGWTARMQDMARMGRVATAYMPLYQAALVIVTHPQDQQRYPARVLSTAPQQTLVQFSNGAQQWVPSGAVQRA
jgi:hypothetical protein